MAQMLKNRFIKARDGLDFSRSLFTYEKRHSFNCLAGYINIAHHQFLYPGDSPDWNFGCVIEGAPMIAPCLDNVYVDIVAIFTPCRLVMTDWNEFLGESHTQAFTINRNITIPKLAQVDCVSPSDAGGNAISRAYLSEHYIAPHVGFRYHKYFDITNPACVPADSIFSKGISVLPSRVYELNWNTFFRNENVQAPILIDKTHVLGTHDSSNYEDGLGRLQVANKLKNFYTKATPAPSLMDVSIALGEMMPVGVIPGANATGIVHSASYPGINGVVSKDVFQGMTVIGSADASIAGKPLLADLSLLTVNKMYYATMLQRFANRMMKGRRAVEFYENFFGIRSSDAGHDEPTLIIQKRYPLNISQVIATASGTNGTEKSDLGQKGAFSTTGFGGKLTSSFMATEHGFFQTYLIIRGQPSLATGIDKHLGYDSLLDTYLLDFDHIGQVGIESLEVSEPYFSGTTATNFGFRNAWYNEREQVSDVVGIMEPTEPLGYKTLAMGYNYGSTPGGLVISDSFLRFNPKILDRLFLFPVCYGTPNTTGYDENGEPYDSNRYQFLVQFVVKGKIAKVMSATSEPLVF